MKLILQIIAITIIISVALALLSVLWPILVLGGIILICWKLYEIYYFKSSSFLEIKNRITVFIENCNELNQHIEELKHTSLIVNKTDFGNATYQDSSKWNYQRKHIKNQEYMPNIHYCSRSVCDNARKKPFEYICKYFGIKAVEEDLISFENLLNNFEAAEDGKQRLQIEKQKILDSIQNDVPALIKKFSQKKLEQNLGFEQIDMTTAYFPKYIFRYTSSGGNASTQCDIVMDTDNLNKFVLFLSDKIKFKKSAAGQRALMTSKLRQKIKERDNFTCKQCGLSTYQEPNLLLEIDHIIPVSKGGLTTEENLQTLCWRCNRHKGAKL